MQDLTGKVWGRFEIIEERGRGGMAVVYKVYDGVLQRTVALKVLLPKMAANREFANRFRQEAITAANLKHPNIVVIYDVGAHQDYQYIVMEYLEGPTLQQEIQQHRVLPMARAVAIVDQLAGALDYAHQQGLVHRDVKPANVIVGKRDHVTLTDFGLVKAARSKITGEGVTVGTLQYMSPEQALGKEIDHRSDIYALGVVVYEMLAGTAPFTGTTAYQALHELVHGPPPHLSSSNHRVEPAVEQVVTKALAKEPASRFGRAGEFARALAAASGLGSPDGRVVNSERLWREAVLRLIGSDGREFPVYAGRSTAGRDVGNDIVIPVQQVSRHHLFLYCDSSGWHVEDTGSTNGTFVNEVRIPAGTRWPIRPEDVLRIGSIQFLVALPAPIGARLDGDTTTVELKPG